MQGDGYLNRPSQLLNEVHTLLLVLAGADVDLIAEHGRSGAATLGDRYRPREWRINAILASVMKLIVSAQLGQFVQRGWL